MQTPAGQSSPDMPYGMSTVLRQLEKLDERTRDIATRADLESLRKEVVAQNVLEPQLTMLKADIARLEAARMTDRKDMEKRLDAMETDQISRSERLWTRLGPAIAAIALLVSIIELLSHIKFTP